MKFTLTYDGELRSNGDPQQKWDIRKKLDPQLRELWATHPCLINAERRRLIPADQGFFPLDGHHSLDSTQAVRPTPPGKAIDLCASIEKGKRQFFPLVRESFALKCGLRIIFLRREEPGNVYQGGDLDNRLKTLFDALSVPNANQVIEDASISDPIHCLFEDDSLITNCTIETHRLLSDPNASKHTVHLLIEADVRVTQPRAYNQVFLGD